MSDYTGWTRPLRVTLTATSNEYLAPRLPLEGYLKVNETGTDHRAMPHGTTFRAIGPDGQPQGAWVAADHAQFTYSGR